MGIEKGTLTNLSPFLPGTIPGNKEAILAASFSKRGCGPFVRISLILPSISIINDNKTMPWIFLRKATLGYLKFFLICFTICS